MCGACNCVALVCVCGGGGEPLPFRPIVVPNVVVDPGGRSYDANSWRRPDKDVANSEKYRELQMAYKAKDSDLDVEGYWWTGV